MRLRRVSAGGRFGAHRLRRRERRQQQRGHGRQRAPPARRAHDQERQPRRHADRRQEIGDVPAAHGRDEIEGHEQRAEDAAERRNAVDAARHRARARGGAQGQPDRIGRIDTEEGQRHEQQQHRADDRAPALELALVGNRAEQRRDELHQRLGEQRNEREIGGAADDEPAEAGGGRLPVGHPAAEEIAAGERRQHGRNQRRPGVDSAAEIGIEIAAAEHLEAHHHRAGDEGIQIDEQQERGCEAALGGVRAVAGRRHGAPPLAGPRRGGPGHRTLAAPGAASIGNLRRR